VTALPWSPTLTKLLHRSSGMFCDKVRMRTELFIAAVIFGGLAGYALSPLPSFAFQTADQRSRIGLAAAQPALPKLHRR
jgi:hypothetical protein